jgi:hypothetical protein
MKTHVAKQELPEAVAVGGTANMLLLQNTDIAALLLMLLAAAGCNARGRKEHIQQSKNAVTSRHAFADLLLVLLLLLLLLLLQAAGRLFDMIPPG